MAEQKAEQKGLSLTILGIVAVVAILGLVLLFKTAVTGEYAYPLSYGGDKLYGGGKTVASQSTEPWTPSWVSGKPVTPEGQQVLTGSSNEPPGITTARTGIKSATRRQAADFTTCGEGLIEVTEFEIEQQGFDPEQCYYDGNLNRYCCAWQGKLN